MNPVFSIIIPAYNGGGTLEECLRGVTKQDYPGAFEALVVESGDGAYLPAMASRFPGVRFVRAPSRLFSGQARNVGAALSSGATLVFLDADCRPARGWLSALAGCHEQGYPVVSGALENGNPESSTGTAEYLVSHSAYSPKTPSRELAGTTAASGNMSVTRELFEDLGGFPGTRRAEDFIFSTRIYDRGMKIVFCPRASVLHLNPDTLLAYAGGQVGRGYWNAMARLELGLQGSIAEKVPLLAFGTFFVRLSRMTTRCLRYRPVPVARFFRLFPLCVLGIAAWTRGYFKASVDRRAGEWREEEPLPAGWESFETICAVNDGGPF